MRKQRTRILTVAILAVMTAGPAVAAGKPLVSPALSNEGPVDTFTCMVVNTGKRATLSDVTIELVRADGSTMVIVGPFPLIPADPRVIFWEDAGELQAYCRVTGSVSKNRTRITLCNGESPGGPCEAIVTGP